MRIVTVNKKRNNRKKPNAMFHKASIKIYLHKNTHSLVTQLIGDKN